MNQCPLKIDAHVASALTIFVVRGGEADAVISDHQLNAAIANGGCDLDVGCPRMLVDVTEQLLGAAVEHRFGVGWDLPQVDIDVDPDTVGSQPLATISNASASPSAWTVGG